MNPGHLLRKLVSQNLLRISLVWAFKSNIIRSLKECVKHTSMIQHPLSQPLEEIATSPASFIPLFRQKQKTFVFAKTILAVVLTICRNTCYIVHNTEESAMSARTKLMKLTAAKLLYLQSPQGLTDIELARKLEIDRSQAYNYRKELGCVAGERGRYTFIPTWDDISLAFAVLQRAQKVTPDMTLHEIEALVKVVQT
jgi:hypothetical protein